MDGNIYNKHMANGGIYFMAHYARENKSTADNAWLQNHISRFDHITIKNNIVKDVDRLGHRRGLHRVPQLHRRDVGATAASTTT